MEHMLFCDASESSLDTSYNVSLSTHFCDCPSRVSTCKHILGVQQIMREYFVSFDSMEATEETMSREGTSTI